MYDLPSEYPGEPALPDEFHSLQALLLLLTFQPPNWNQERIFSAMDLYLYYDVAHPLWYKRPDWFGVVGIPRLYEGRDSRLSYVIWQEKVSPIVVVELLSPGTEGEDLGQKVKEQGKPPSKWEVYEQILKIPYYVVFSRYTSQMQAFHLVAHRYQPVNPTEGRLQIPELELSLGLWQGSFRSLNRLWLRWLTREGDAIPLASEEVVQAQQEAAQARQEAAQARQEAERLKTLLRDLGVDPEAI
jgi:Uma2 family endonuclease